MKYLVILSTIAHVSMDFIVGYGENSTELVSILSDLIKWYTRNNISYEEFITWYSLDIYLLTDSNYQKITTFNEKYENEIAEQKKEWDAYKCENYTGNYLFLLFENSEGPTDLTKSDCKLLKKIIKNSSKLS